MPILVGARRLADDHQRRAGDAVGEHRIGGGALQGAAFETGHRQLASSRERLRRLAAAALAPPDGAGDGGGAGAGRHRYVAGAGERAGQAVLRTVADRLVGAHGDVPAQQFGRGFGAMRPRPLAL